MMARAPRGLAAAVSLLVACVVVPAARAASAPTSAIGSYARVNGLRMYYEVHGAGPVLVLLHGGGGNGQQFERQVPAFERHFRVIVPDMCAQGRTSDRAAPLTYHAMAEDVITLMNHLGVRRFDVMGWSDGGIIGLDLAIHHPERLRRLVTFGANFAPDGLTPTDVAWDDTATVAAFGDDARAAWQKLAPDPADYDAAMKKILHLWKYEPRFTVRELRSIRQRVMVCAGDHDVVRRDHTEVLAEAIPRARLWIVTAASHNVIQEQPALVNARVLAFLTER